MRRMAGLLIGDGSKRTGVPTSTIRYYEEIGLLPAPVFRRQLATDVAKWDKLKKGGTCSASAASGPLTRLRHTAPR